MSDVSREQSPNYNIDIAPTILEAAGIEKPVNWGDQPVPEAPGRSLLGAFAEDKVIDREFLWWLHEGNRAVRAGDWNVPAPSPNRTGSPIS